MIESKINTKYTHAHFCIKTIQLFDL